MTSPNSKNVFIKRETSVDRNPQSQNQQSLNIKGKETSQGKKIYFDGANKPKSKINIADFSRQTHN